MSDTVYQGKNIPNGKRLITSNFASIHYVEAISIVFNKGGGGIYPPSQKTQPYPPVFRILIREGVYMYKN